MAARDFGLKLDSVSLETNAIELAESLGHSCGVVGECILLNIEAAPPPSP
jgi:hypothetical protein